MPVGAAAGFAAAVELAAAAADPEAEPDAALPLPLPAEEPVGACVVAAPEPLQSNVLATWQENLKVVKYPLDAAPVAVEAILPEALLLDIEILAGPGMVVKKPPLG